MIIKYTTLNDVGLYKNWVLCHEVNLDGKMLPKGSILSDNLIEYIKENRSEFYDVFLIISNEPINDDSLKVFIKDTIKTLLDKQIKYINDNYCNIISENYIPRIKIIILASVDRLDLNYFILLTTNPIILRKSLNLTILSFYFTIVMKLSFRELEDIIYATMLCNLNLCNNLHIELIKEDGNNFLINLKKSLINSSYEIIKSDKVLSNNTKRLIRYFNEKSNKYSDVCKCQMNNEPIFKDVTLEIMQLSDNILSYGSIDSSFNSSYISRSDYSFVSRAIDQFIDIVCNYNHNKKLKNIMDIFKFNKKKKKDN